MPHQRRRSPPQEPPPPDDPTRDSSSGPPPSRPSHAAFHAQEHPRAQPTQTRDPKDQMALYERRPAYLPETDVNRFGPALPPIQSGVHDRGYSRDGRGLPPMQLPPMRASPPLQQPQPNRAANHTMSVTSLLSRNPDSPKRTHRTPVPERATSMQAQPPPLPPQQSIRSSPSVYGSSPNDERGLLPARPPMGQHYMDHPPRQQKVPVPAPAFPSQQFHFSRPGYPSTASEPDLPHHSPATSHPYSPSHYPQSSEPSPTSAFAPPYFEPSPPQISQAPPLNYQLHIRQQPVAARACGYGERDRRVIDPPPILELRTIDKATGAPEIDHAGMLALHCTLLNNDGSEDESEVVQAHPEGPASRRLMGSLVAAPYQAKDENGIAGTFFVFPDLSCRNPGKYRLKFSLLRIDPMCMTPGTKHPTVAHIMTEPFSVYTAKDFPGMRASSGLLKALRRQGLNVGVKKGSEARKGKGKGKAKKEASSDEEDEESDGSEHDERKPSNASGGTDESADNVSPKAKKNAKSKKRRRGSQ